MEQQQSVRDNPLAFESTGRLIAKYSVPSVIAMLVSSLYNIVDQIFIGQGVGMLGNAATNVAFPFVNISKKLCRHLDLSPDPLGPCLKYFFPAVPETDPDRHRFHETGISLCPDLHEDHRTGISFSDRHQRILQSDPV